MRRMLSGSPQDVVLADAMVAGISAVNNNYSYGSPLVTFSGVNGATSYVNSSDCSTFQTELLMQAYGFTASQFASWTGYALPQSQDLYNAALDDKGFTGFLQIGDVQAGDEMFIKYIQTDSEGDTGHCVMVDQLPVLVSISSTGRVYDLTVVDCTADPHSNDTRIDGQSGVGRGTMRIYTDSSGNMTSYSWGTSPESVIETASERPAIFAKAPAVAGSTFLAAGSQATWNASNFSLVVTGPATIITDPTSAKQPVITMNGSSAQLLIMSGVDSIIHVASLTMTNGSSAVISSPGSGQLLLDVAANVGNGLVSIDATSQLDLGSNDMIVHGGSLAAINGLISRGCNGGTWTGNGITSSAAASDTTCLTALGAIYNTNGTGTLYTTFDGVSASSTDVIVRHTYYGDTNLDGKLDGTDYSKIDNGYLHHTTLTGWANGDLNYDGTINGSDYTLIDNAFNMQGSQLTFSPESETAIPGVVAQSIVSPGRLTAVPPLWPGDNPGENASGQKKSGGIAGEFLESYS